MRKVWQEIQEGNFWILDAAPQTGRPGDVERGRLHDVASLRAERAFRMRRPRSLRNCASAIPIGANKAW